MIMDTSTAGGGTSYALPPPRSSLSNFLLLAASANCGLSLFRCIKYASSTLSHEHICICVSVFVCNFNVSILPALDQF